MAVQNFSLAELFEATFGYRTQAFEPEFKEVKSESPLLRKDQGVHGSPYFATDALGAEYFLPVTIIYPETAPLPNNAPQSSTLPDLDETSVLKRWELPYPIVTISSKKTIVETALTERRGTVKELINVQDYEIVIKGFLIGKGNEFPEEDVATLRAIYELNTPVSIQCPLTDVFLLQAGRKGSDYVVIKDLKILPISGVKNIRPYELHLVSDEVFNLITIS